MKETVGVMKNKEKHVARQKLLTYEILELKDWRSDYKNRNPTEYVQCSNQNPLLKWKQFKEQWIDKHCKDVGHLKEGLPQTYSFLEIIRIKKLRSTKTTFRNKNGKAVLRKD